MRNDITILVDKSGSMNGEPLKMAHEMIKDIIFSFHELHDDLYSRHEFIRIVSYNSNPHEELHYHEISYIRKTRPKGIDLEIGMVQPPFFNFNGHGPKCLGKAIDYVCDNNPSNILLIITKGTPSDILYFRNIISKCKTIYDKIYVFHGNFSRKQIYEELTDKIFHWNEINFLELVKRMFDINKSKIGEVLSAPPKVIEISI